MGSVDRARSSFAAAVLSTVDSPSGRVLLSVGHVPEDLERAAATLTATRAAASRPVRMTPALERWAAAVASFVARERRAPSVRELAAEAGKARTPAAAAIGRLRQLERWDDLVAVGPQIPGSP